MNSTFAVQSMAHRAVEGDVAIGNYRLQLFIGLLLRSTNGLATLLA